ncbi:MAG: hypothetical protein ACI9HY_002383, partial [Planctomycetaceae bacterium]
QLYSSLPTSHLLNLHYKPTQADSARGGNAIDSHLELDMGSTSAILTN